MPLTVKFINHFGATLWEIPFQSTIFNFLKNFDENLLPHEKYFSGLAHRLVKVRQPLV